MGGASEPQFRAMIKALGWGWHKYGDVRYCIWCHKPLPKSELMPDFMVNIKPIFVEVKNNDKSGKWNWRADIGPEGARKAQRAFLIENDGWLFIELGLGRRPKDFSAYLLPMSTWLEIEQGLEQSSLPREDTSRLLGGDTVLRIFGLTWGNGVWNIPKGHVWWYHLQVQIKSVLNLIEERL